MRWIVRLIFTGAMLSFLVLAGQWVMQIQYDFHDKAINANSLQRLWSQGGTLPVDEIVPSNNKWTKNAFIAETRSSDGPNKIRVLILDDHYLGKDMTYRSRSGVIGDEISEMLLCSLPAKAKRTRLKIDPVVMDMINSRCAIVL